MMQDEIIRMARESGATVDDRGPVAIDVARLERFAAMVAAAAIDKRVKVSWADSMASF